MADQRRGGLRPPRTTSGAVDTEGLRRTALEALALEEHGLVVDLRDLEDNAEAAHALHDVQAAARHHHRSLTIELPGLTVQIDSSGSTSDAGH